MIRSQIICLLTVMVVAGCSNQGLRDLRSNSAGPDEFLILPSKPLAEPENFTELPPPTPGGTNLTDPAPKADAIAALGGRPSALETQGVSTTDSALVAHVSRNGVPQGIRQTLAEEDEDFRRRRGRLTQIRLFRVDRYVEVYRREKIDPFEEERRLRRSGIATPTSPPENL